MEIKTFERAEMIPMKKIRPYWRNPRKNEDTVEALKSSIQEFGYRVPIVVDEQMVIISGHARYKALDQLGYTEALCIISDMSPEEAKEFRLIDNKISELSTWDLESLKRELEQIEQIEELTELGFKEFEIQALSDDVEIELDSLDEIEVDIDGDFGSDAPLGHAINANKGDEEYEEVELEITCPSCLGTYKKTRSDILGEDKS